MKKDLEKKRKRKEKEDHSISSTKMVSSFNFSKRFPLFSFFLHPPLKVERRNVFSRAKHFYELTMLWLCT